MNYDSICDLSFSVDPVDFSSYVGENGEKL